MKTTRKRKSATSNRKTATPSTMHLLRANAGSAMRQGRRTIGQAYDWAHETARTTGFGPLRLPRRSDIASLTEANPLLLGAVGLGIGVALGSLFPRGFGRERSAGARAAAARKRSRARRRKNGKPAA